MNLKTDAIKKAPSEPAALYCLCEGCCWSGMASECRIEHGMHVCPRCGSATEPESQ